MTIPEIVAALITEHEDHVGEYFASVACVEHRGGRWLLGLSTAGDDRGGHWCFVGGGIEDGETPEQAAVRECHEEAGIRVRKQGAAFKHKKDGVAFVHCRTETVGVPKIKHNKEFSAMGFFTVKEMKSLKLYSNVKELIRRCSG